MTSSIDMHRWASWLSHHLVAPMTNWYHKRLKKATKVSSAKTMKMTDHLTGLFEIHFFRKFSIHFSGRPNFPKDWSLINCFGHIQKCTSNFNMDYWEKLIFVRIWWSELWLIRTEKNIISKKFMYWIQQQFFKTFSHSSV